MTRPDFSHLRGTRKGFVLNMIGDEEVRQRIEALPIATQRKILRPAMKAGAKVLREAVRGATPPDLNRHLRGRYRIATGRSRRRGRITYRVFLPGRQRLGIKESRRPGSKGGEGAGYWPVFRELGFKQFAVHVPRRTIPGIGWMRRTAKSAASSVRGAVAAEARRRLAVMDAAAREAGGGADE